MEAILELSFEAVPTAATHARTEMTERFASRLATRVLEDVRLLVTELITNALRHGSLRNDDRVSLKAWLTGDILRIEVRDPGRAGDVTPRQPGQRDGGYGLYLVEQLTKRWGVDCRDGTVVWCEVPSGADR
jgi:anti-sigma regulatory factor (Ser/Thr protein kinase)